MKLDPLFKWFGSKWRAAKKYPEPLTNKIIEPFAGGAGYALNFADRDVTIYDTDPNLIALWKYLISAKSDEIRAIPINLPFKTDIATLGLNQGQALLLKNWQRTNNTSSCNTISKWGNQPGQFTAYTRARVADQVQAIKHWQFDENCWNDKAATYFIDPPYQYNIKYKIIKRMDYAILAQDVKSIAKHNQVIVCEALGKNGEIPEWLDFKASHTTATMKKGKRSSELVWLANC